MNPMKLKVLSELLDHLSDSQGSDLKSLLDSSKNPMEGNPSDEALNPLASGEKPQGLKIESVEVADGSDLDKKKTLGETIGYPGFEKQKKKPTAMLEEGLVGDGEKEMDDDELEELIHKYSQV